MDLVAPVDFCPDFKRLLLAAKEGFVGAMIKKGDRLIPKIKLKGWDECHIHDIDTDGGKAFYQSCELPDTSDKKELEDVAAKVHSVLKDCLGSDWAEETQVEEKAALDLHMNWGIMSPKSSFVRPRVERVTNGACTSMFSPRLSLSLNIPKLVLMFCPKKSMRDFGAGRGGGR